MGPQQFVNALSHRRDLRAHRAGLHDGLRDHRADQLRPRRRVHGRRVRQPWCFLTVARLHGRHRRTSGPAGRRPVRRRSSCRCGVMGVIGVAHRAVRLPAAPPCPAPRTADHRDRRLVHPAERRPLVLRTGRPTRAADLPGRLVDRVRAARASRVLSLFIFALAVVLMIALQLFVARTRLGRAMRATAAGPRGRRADGRRHQPDDRPHLPLGSARSPARRAWSGACSFGVVRFRPRLQRRPEGVHRGRPRRHRQHHRRRARRVHHRLHRGLRRRRSACADGPSSSCSAILSSSSCSGPPASSASRWVSAHDRRGDRPKPRAPADRRAASGRSAFADATARRRSSSRWRIVGRRCLPLLPVFPPLTLAPDARTPGSTDSRTRACSSCWRWA